MLFATYNIHYGLGSDHRYDVARIADAVAAADVICLQEVVQGWALNAFADQAAEIAARLNRYAWFHGAFDADSSAVGGDGRIVNRRRTFGNAVLSRWPISEARGHLLPKTSLPTQFDLQRGMVEAVIAAPSQPLRVYSLHLSHLTPRQRLPQIAAVLELVHGAARRGGTWDHQAADLFGFSEKAPPVPTAAVVMGDFNFTHADPEYPAICGELHPFMGRITQADGLVDAWAAAGNVEDRESFPGHGRIDHCFITADLAPQVRRAWIDDTTPASDHFPLFVELDV
ncbi:endonuclease/exonuclease/phosphatase family protein [Vineibacter terrae]|uniref:endonuclease/exonuclease/phosphatase family protein n=1 Tax=Vineibacter terrae TaxID=2586908 RepID=UPI002E300555|nr:endonuclease/exonuclease/phosphatase family protein [Vineibacter terrae]HEX2887316.1 endonuclease/exonuclease/phosphatase family protein [Vineibacter terrae]